MLDEFCLTTGILNALDHGCAPLHAQISKRKPLKAAHLCAVSSPVSRWRQRFYI